MTNVVVLGPQFWKKEAIKSRTRNPAALGWMEKREGTLVGVRTRGVYAPPASASATMEKARQRRFIYT